MAGHRNSVSNLIQSGIESFIQRSPGNQQNQKRSLSSPETDNPLPKRSTMLSQEDQSIFNNKTALQLLYDSLSKKIDQKIEPVESKLNSLVGSEFNLPKHIEDVNEIKVQHKNLERKLTKVEHENENLKQKIINLEDKMLEHNIVLSGINENKWEELEPRREKVSRELARIVTGDTQAERIENAKKLDIMSTE